MLEKYLIENNIKFTNPENGLYFIYLRNREILYIKNEGWSSCYVIYPGGEITSRKDNVIPSPFILTPNQSIDFLQGHGENSLIKHLEDIKDYYSARKV